MIVSLTIIRYPKLLIPFALLAMAIHRLPLWLNNKCTFWKLMGSGHNGTFDLQPDWQQWALLATWNNQQDFDGFYNTSFIASWWKFFNTERWTLLCEPIQSHGKWDGKDPFAGKLINDYTGPVAVLTRATIRISKLKGFCTPSARKLPSKPERNFFGEPSGSKGAKFGGAKTAEVYTPLLILLLVKP